MVINKMKKEKSDSLEKEFNVLRKKYIEHLNMPNKQPIQEWENKRKDIHEEIFLLKGITRNSKKGKEFSKIFDESIELELNNYNEVFAKRINNCQTKEEMDKEIATLEFLKKWQNK